MTKNKNVDSPYKYLFSEIKSSINNDLSLSVCKVSFKQEKKDHSKINRRRIFFVPEVGISYKSYFPYFESLLLDNIASEVVTYDHFGGGLSGGRRGYNVREKYYLLDFKSILEFQNSDDMNSQLIVYGHGMGALVTLIAESEGVIKDAAGIVINDPFMKKITSKRVVGFPQLMRLKKLNRFFKSKSYAADDFFQGTQERINFEYNCLNQQYINLDLSQTLQYLSKSVIERAYLNERMILFMSRPANTYDNSELINLYKKGVGENKVTSVELKRHGHFDNFTRPSKEDFCEFKEWVDGLK